jgi:hypothetical protein
MADFTVSTDIDTFLQSADNAAARGSLGVIDYPYTTDFQSGVEQTRNLTTITSSDGYNYNSNLSSIYVGRNVTSIGSYAFYYCTGLTSITISSGVTSLGSYCFGFCSGLTSVIIPDSVTSLGSAAFGYCGSLTSITIGNSVPSLGDRFCSSTALTSVTIPNSVTSIGSMVFFMCTSLATINCLATTAPTLGSNAFFNVAATDIHVPVGATGYGTTYGGLTVVADL